MQSNHVDPIKGVEQVQRIIISEVFLFSRVNRTLDVDVNIRVKKITSAYKHTVQSMCSESIYENKQRFIESISPLI